MREFPTDLSGPTQGRTRYDLCFRWAAMSRFTLLATPLLFAIACAAACAPGSASVSGPAPGASESPASPEESFDGSSDSATGNVCTGVASAPSCEAALDVASADEAFAQIAQLVESVEGSTKK